MKWHLPNSSSAEHRGHTGKALIREHKAIYDYHKVVPVRLIIDRNQALHGREVHFAVLQEYSEGGRGESVLLGNVKINLAEYVDDGKGPEKREAEGGEGEDDCGIVRRYLMQDSKINSTLKIGIKMRQLEGDTTFTAPPLKKAVVFGGIAGVMSTEVSNGRVDEAGGHMPSVATKTREMSEMQDIYRRTLAATWSCGFEELPPDKLIEDLFAGGDGGTMKPPPPIAKSRASPIPIPQQESPQPDDEAGGDGASVGEFGSKRQGAQNLLTPDMARRGQGARTREGGNERWKSASRGGTPDSASSTNTSTRSGISGRESIEQQIHLSYKDKNLDGQRRLRGVSEFDIRENLRSWKIEVR